MKKKKGGARAAWVKLLSVVHVFGAGGCVALHAAFRADYAGPHDRLGTRDPGKWAPVVVIFAYTPASFLMFPRPLLTLLTVIAFGPWLGFVYGMTGILIAALTTTVFGDQIATALEDISRINYWLIGGAVVIFGMLAYFVRRWLANQDFE